ncbi:DUF2214 family protein [Usitatibacter palustris]|uniref:DUF2214 domain-containing protein n=1 Tax=Usitatibacter palustris TaxID=2732487 RepID=A0A6M4H9B5_9PROT|nr:DUF2214 family protein [Usitatibacter palustris]QJR16180.1 hypothetical protein DSM104440_03009 [Usitatibacter palustris]
MWLDALLAYLHFIAIFILFAFLSCQLIMLRSPLDATAIRRLAIVDMVYGASAGLVFITGLLRLFYGAKGSDFYLHAWPIYVKVGLFLAAGLLSIKPTLTFLRWRRAVNSNPTWELTEADRVSMRRVVLIELHLLAMVPVFAVVMARGLGK